MARRLMRCRIYAGDLKEMLGYTQTQIQGIMSPLFISAVVGWLPGLFYDSLERHHQMGPRYAPVNALINTHACNTLQGGYTTVHPRSDAANPSSGQTLTDVRGSTDCLPPCYSCM